MIMFKIVNSFLGTMWGNRRFYGTDSMDIAAYTNCGSGVDPGAIGGICAHQCMGGRATQ